MEARSIAVLAIVLAVAAAEGHEANEVVSLGEGSLAGAPNVAADTKLSALKEKVDSLRTVNTATQDKIAVLKAHAGAWSVEAARAATASGVSSATAQALERKVKFARKVDHPSSLLPLVMSLCRLECFLFQALPGQ